MKQTLFSIPLIFLLNSCILIQMGQESVEKIKTSTTYGYQNGSKPDTIRNIKDFIAEENDFVILAENPTKTLYKARNKSNMGKHSMLSDPIKYCEAHGGKVGFGSQFGYAIRKEFDSIDFEFSSVPAQYKENRIPGYKGWLKCEGSDDDFEINRKPRSDYFIIEHQKEQLQGYALQWYISYFDLKNVKLDSINVGIWNDNSLVQIGGLCYQHQGRAFISNRFTANRPMDLNNYLLQQLEPTSSSKGYILASGHFTCQSKNDGITFFDFSIDYSEKYHKLIYTKD